MEAYDKHGGYTQQAQKLAVATHEATDSIVKEWIRNGYPPEFVQYVMQEAIHMQILLEEMDIMIESGKKKNQTNQNSKEE